MLLSVYKHKTWGSEVGVFTSGLNLYNQMIVQILHKRGISTAF